jgi:hypothetical protein
MFSRRSPRWRPLLVADRFESGQWVVVAGGGRWPVGAAADGHGYGTAAYAV